jgi:hypothetical protein
MQVVVVGQERLELSSTPGAGTDAVQVAPPSWVTSMTVCGIAGLDPGAAGSTAIPSA